MTVVCRLLTPFRLLLLLLKTTVVTRQYLTNNAFWRDVLRVVDRKVDEMVRELGLPEG